MIFIIIAKNIFQHASAAPGMVEPVFYFVVVALDSGKMGGVMAMINMIAVRARGNDCSELLLQDLLS